MAWAPIWFELMKAIAKRPAYIPRMCRNWRHNWLMLMNQSSLWKVWSCVCHFLLYAQSRSYWAIDRNSITRNSMNSHVEIGLQPITISASASLRSLLRFKTIEYNTSQHYQWRRTLQSTTIDWSSGAARVNQHILTNFRHVRSRSRPPPS